VPLGCGMSWLKLRYCNIFSVLNASFRNQRIW